MSGPHHAAGHGPPPVMLHYAPPQQGGGSNPQHGPPPQQGAPQHFYIGPGQGEGNKPPTDLNLSSCCDRQTQARMKLTAETKSKVGSSAGKPEGYWPLNY